MFSDKQIWLISHSPRRIQLLTELGINFQTGVADIDETYPNTLAPKEIPIYLSRIKADNATCPLLPNTIIITADTVVSSGDHVLGKPADAQQAFDMLQMLSGHTHQVITGVTLRSQSRTISFAEVTDVTFAQLSDDDIRHYISKYQPYDKAGAYGIQEWIGMIGVESISGCFYNVMGLPVSRLYRELKAFVDSEQ